ncbi:MAG TPA: type 1 glutamine amidotransferase [Candidatus Saccharimonadales bacterium]|nr:type 1 glutamine amidotransferase [Candidatus Saccharimonadales bacterium]
MTVNHHDIKVLLVQLRREAVMRNHEYDGVLRSGKLEPGQITRVNGLEEPLEMAHLDDRQLLFIGGSGDYSVFDELPFMPVLTKMLQKCRQDNIPVLGSCWGGQYMAHVLGGETVTDPETEEIGTYLMYKTDGAKSDPLFSDFPAQFLAQIGHHERISQLPPGAVNLVKSDKTPIQAFTWPGSAQYALQFHPELDKTGLVERVIHYREAYAADPLAFDVILNNAKESPWTDHLVERFIERIVLPRYSALNVK